MGSSTSPCPPASKIDSFRSKVDLLKLPLALSTKSISERKSQLGGAREQATGGGGARKPCPPTRDMDNESQYSGYSYKSSHSRSSRKHRYQRVSQTTTTTKSTSVQVHFKQSFHKCFSETLGSNTFVIRTHIDPLVNGHIDEQPHARITHVPPGFGHTMTWA